MSALQNTLLWRGSAQELERDREVHVPGCWEEGAALIASALCVPTAHYSTVVSPTAASSTNTAFSEQA